MAKKRLDGKIRAGELASSYYSLFDIFRKERIFVVVVVVFTILSALIYHITPVAAWVGFALAAYAAIANDSIQTIGTFIASNKSRKWYILWLFMGSIFVITVLISWNLYDGDVSWQRLSKKGFSEAPSEFSYLQLVAPIVLLVLTRLRMPVSTTFLLLNVFATKSSAIIHVLDKSLTGYFLAFFTSFIVWILVSRFLAKYIKGKPAGYWIYLQWITSGMLWAVWLMQDAANIAIFLPRSLSAIEVTVFISTIFLGLGVLFYLKGDKIQGIVTEKSGITDVRAATLIDFVYAALLYYKLFESPYPMSTTWLFIGLLGGRELAISLNKNKLKKRKKSIKRTFRIIGRDLLYALIGLIVSLIMALMINTQVRQEIFEMLF